MDRWLDIRTEASKFAAAAGWVLSTRALATWRAALKACVAGDLVIDALQQEYQITLEQKGEIVATAAARFDKTGAFSGNPWDATGRFPSAHDALVVALGQFPDCGDDVQMECGELARVFPWERMKEILPHVHRFGAYYSSSWSSWKRILARPTPFRDRALLDALQGRICGSRDPNIFSTLADWVDRLGLAGDHLAERLRNELGLPHLRQKELAEVRLTEQTVRGTGILKKPTIADARAYQPFMPSSPVDETGIARDVSSRNRRRRGGPEVWHGDVTARQASGLRFIGAPGSPLMLMPWRRL